MARLLETMPLVLTHRANSPYDDDLETRYHFPRTYLNTVQRGVGDLFVYYEPRRNDGREAYFAMGRLGVVSADQTNADHFYVSIAGYEEFPSPVPWRGAGAPYELRLRQSDGSLNAGLFQRAVRELSHAELDSILEVGFRRALPEAFDALLLGEMNALQPRRIAEVVTQRPVRDRAFMLMVRDAYAQTCALTGLRIVNGGGWTEMEAAHIQPVEREGPDSVRNGLALSRTMHALFDRGFVSLSDDYTILEARSWPLPEQLRATFNRGGVAVVPDDPRRRPHRAFLEFHRRNIFKDRAA